MTQNQPKENPSKGNNTGRKTTSKQIVAIIGVVLLAAMYVLTLIAALFDNAATMTLFRACLIATFTIPLLIWVYIWMYGKLAHKHTIADLDLDLGQNTADKE